MGTAAAAVIETQQLPEAHHELHQGQLHAVQDSGGPSVEQIVMQTWCIPLKYSLGMMSVAVHAAQRMQQSPLAVTDNAKETTLEALAIGQGVQDDLAVAAHAISDANNMSVPGVLAAMPVCAEQMQERWTEFWDLFEHAV